MIDFIQSETKKMMYKCCERYARENSLNVEDVQLILGLDEGLDENRNTYTICNDYVRKENYDIMEVLGVKIDFLGYSKLAPPFILKSLVRFSEKHKISLDKVLVMCVPTKNEKGKNDILLFVYNDNQYVETINFDDLFREEDFELPTN
jgi:hypothetical protein